VRRLPAWESVRAVSWSKERGVRQSPAGKNVNTEAKDSEDSACCSELAIVL
jgi:hypothetical protein